MQSAIQYNCILMAHLLFDSVVGNLRGAEIICYDGRWSLRMLVVDDPSVDDDGVTDVEEESTELCFAG